MDVQGWVVVGLTLVLFGYLVPHLVHSRQQLADARLEDRFSTSLRVVTTGGAERAAHAGEHHGGPGGRPYLHDPRRRTEAPAVNRPTTRTERSAADARRLAAARAARAAEISRRRAAARRRLVLTLVLLVASVGGWLAFGLGSAPLALGVVPTVLLAVVLVLGRRAAKIAARRNAADRAAMARLELHPAPRRRPTAATRPAMPDARSAAGEAATATAAATDAESRTPDSATSAAAPSAAAATPAPSAADATPTPSGADSAPSATDAGPTPTPSGVDSWISHPPAADSEPTTTAGTSAEAETAGGTEEGAAWTPVPVPAPAYTLKAPAPRRSVAPYEPVEAASQAARPESDGGTATVSSGLAGSPYGPVTPTEAEVAPSPEEAPAAGMDLSTVLARRRAVGA